MLGKVKVVVQKKVNQVPQASVLMAPLDPTPTAVPPKKKKKRKKRKHKKKASVSPVSPTMTPVVKNKNLSLRKKKVVDESVDEDSSEEETDEVPAPKITVGHKPVSQIIPPKPDTRAFTHRVLTTERPELISSCCLTPEELVVLDNYLLQKGTLRSGFTVTLGRIVDSESGIKVGSGDVVEVISLIANGRFAGVYMANKDVTSEQERRGLGSTFALKISRRMYATTRIMHEIAILEHIFKNSRRNNCSPNHITPIFFHGTSGGTPYLVMPMMDSNLKKVREDVGGKIRWCDAFYIGQEALVGVKECHSQQIIHRDIKPTNILLGIQNPRSWWLCDFGDACMLGRQRLLSPSDATTLPFMSREAHKATSELTTPTVRMDLESWFYVLLELFIQLPWALVINEVEAVAAKVQFWNSLTQFFQTNSVCLPPQLSQIAQTLAGNCDEQVYNRLTVILKDGFTKYLDTQPWRPSWMERRKPLLKASPRRAPQSRSTSKRNTGKKG